MTLEERITELEKNYALLATSFLGAQSSQVPITAKTDDSANKIVELTPYTETKVGYYGETEKTFYNVPEGNVTVFGLDEYSMTRIADRIRLTFEPLSEHTEITISIL